MGSERLPLTRQTSFSPSTGRRPRQEDEGHGIDKVRSGRAPMTGFTQRVELAAGAMRALFPETPLQESAYLSRKTGAHIFLKREDLSPVRSYKIRGAFNFFRKALAAGEGAEVF